MAEVQMSPEEIAKNAQGFLDNLFSYHAPFGDQASRYQRIRGVAKNLAVVILASAPASREQHLALDALRCAVMFANAAIACNEVDPGAVPAEVGASEPVAAAHVQSANATRPQAENVKPPVAPDADKQEKAEADATALPPAVEPAEVPAE